MSKQSPLITKRLISLLWAVGLSLGLSGVIALGGGQRIDQALYDWFLRITIEHRPIPLDPRIIRVDLNDTSEAALGEDLASRKAFAELIEALGNLGSRAALDFIFKSNAPYDEAFAEATSSMEALYLAVTPIEEDYANFSHQLLSEEERALLKKSLWHITEQGTGTIPRARSFIMSNPAITAPTATLGHIAVESDEDGKYRRTPLLYRWEDGLIPAMPLAIAVDDWGVPVEDIVFIPGEALILPIPGDKPIRIPVDQGGYAIIPYTGRWADDSYRISFHRVVEANHDPVLFQELAFEIGGSIALVADITTTKRDFGVTPFEPVYPLSGIHASILSGILNETFYTYPPWYLKLLLCLALAILASILVFSPKEIIYHGGFLLLFTLYSTLSFFLWYRLKLLPWYGIPAVGIFTWYLTGFICRLFYRYKEQILLKNALSRYFPRALAERIAAEGKTELIPAYKELTIIFTDISGFTKWSSDKEPEAVHTFLTDYLESMARILFEYGGTVDKFMGDGILAFFGDPFEMPDHAERCVKAALAMQRRAAELAETWRPQVQINLRVRMGINTGRVIVGNLGTKTRIEYTVIGAAVNLAQRMEGNAPVGGILVTKDTWERVKDTFPFGEKRLITVKGYDEPIEGYEFVDSLAGLKKFI